MEKIVRQTKRILEPLVGLILLAVVLYLAFFAFAEPAEEEHAYACDEAAAQGFSDEERIALCGDPFFEEAQENFEGGYPHDILYHD